MQCCCILHRQLSAHPHLLRHVTEDHGIYMKGENNIGSGGGEAVADIVIEAAPNGRHADDDRDTDDNSEHGQRRAQLVAADRIGRHVDDLAEFGFAKHKNLVIEKFGN